MRQSTFWDRLYDAQGAEPIEEQAFKVWVCRDESGVCINAQGWPYGRPYRHVAAELAALGVVNGGGRPYHPHHLKQLIARAITNKTYAMVGEKHDAEARRRLYSEVWRALRQKGLAKDGNKDRRKTPKRRKSDGE